MQVFTSDTLLAEEMNLHATLKQVLPSDAKLNA